MMAKSRSSSTRGNAPWRSSADIPATYLDWAPPVQETSIGTLLDHIAAFEADWLSTEVREGVPFAPELVALFPCNVRDGAERLSFVAGLTSRSTLRTWRRYPLSYRGLSGRCPRQTSAAFAHDPAMISPPGARYTI